MSYLRTVWWRIVAPTPLTHRQKEGGWIGLVLAAAGLLYNMIQGNKASNAATDAANANSTTAQENARNEVIRANENLMEQEQQNRYERGSMITSAAGSGVELKTGSPLDDLSQQYAEGLFKDQVAVFNGMVNVGYDEAAAIQAEKQGEQVSAQISASEASTIASLGMQYYQSTKSPGG